MFFKMKFLSIRCNSLKIKAGSGPKTVNFHAVPPFFYTNSRYMRLIGSQSSLLIDTLRCGTGLFIIINGAERLQRLEPQSN